MARKLTLPTQTWAPTNFRWCQWGAEQRVKCARAWEQGPPSATVEICSCFLLNNVLLLSIILYKNLAGADRGPHSWVCARLALCLMPVELNSAQLEMEWLHYYSLTQHNPPKSFKALAKYDPCNEILIPGYLVDLFSKGIVLVRAINLEMILYKMLCK